MTVDDETTLRAITDPWARLDAAQAIIDAAAGYASAVRADTVAELVDAHRPLERRGRGYTGIVTDIATRLGLHRNRVHQLADRGRTARGEATSDAG